MRLFLTSILLPTCLLAQSGSVPDQLTIEVQGKPFAIFHTGKDANKPFLAPLRSASGKIVTRGFPMETIAGESRDHLHHRGLWFSYDDVNNVKFWENDPSYTKGIVGKILVTAATLDKNETTPKLTASMNWQDPTGKVLLVEDRIMTFSGTGSTRTIDFDITLTAREPVTFGDTKEGAFAIRLNDAFTEKKGMKMTDADGRSRMAAIWGKRSNWVDYSADVDGETLGVAMFDHPGNPHHPTYWHARDYGLFALNPFGQNAFDPKAPESHMKLATGEKLRFRWRVLIHDGDAAAAHVGELYKAYSAQ